MTYARLCILALLLMPLSVQATTVRLLSEQQMTEKAVSILRGTVTSVVPRRHRTGLIVTDVTLRVARALKAETAESTVQFTQLGGTLDGKTLHVSGTSAYAVGEEVLVFLERGGDSLVELGVGAGKYRVLRADGRAWVERQVGRLAFVTYAGKAGSSAPPPASTTEPLASFEARIASYVGE